MEGLAKCYALQDRWDEVPGIVKEMLEGRQSDRAACVIEAEYHIHRGDRKAALEALESYLKHYEGGNTGYWEKVHPTLMRLGEYDRVLANAERWAAQLRTPDDADHLHSEFLAYLAKGDMNKAKERLDRIQRLYHTALLAGTDPVRYYLGTSL